MRRPARQPRNRRAFRSFQERRGHRDGLSVDGGAARGTGAIGDVVIADAPVSMDGSSRFVDSNGYRFFAGLRSDPHFKDGVRVTAETLSCREPRSAVLGLSLLAGASLQSQADRLAAQHRRQVRALLPAVVGLAVILMVGEFLLLVLVNRIAAAVALLATILLMTRLLISSRARRSTGREERIRNVSWPNIFVLESLGFVSLPNRRIARLREDVDEIVIGPPGVFALEVRTATKRLEITGDRLFLGEYEPVPEYVDARASGKPWLVAL